MLPRLPSASSACARRAGSGIACALPRHSASSRPTCGNTLVQYVRVARANTAGVAGRRLPGTRVRVTGAPRARASAAALARAAGGPLDLRAQRRQPPLVGHAPLLAGEPVLDQPEPLQALQQLRGLPLVGHLGGLAYLPVGRSRCRGDYAQHEHRAGGDAHRQAVEPSCPVAGRRPAELALWYATPLIP